jgi:hypothetical protein
MKDCKHDFKHSFEGEIILYIEFKCKKCGIVQDYSEELNREVLNKPMDGFETFEIRLDY